MLMSGLRMAAMVLPVLAVVLFLLVLMTQGRRVLPHILPGALVFGMLCGIVTALVSAGTCAITELCANGDELLGAPLGFGAGVLWFLFWWWKEARPHDDP